MTNARSGNRRQLSEMLLDLRKHLNTCDHCRIAVSCEDFVNVCEWSLKTITTIAMRWDKNISGRLKVARGEVGGFYPCPDPSAHGSDYALTVEPMIGESVVSRLI